MLDYLFKVLFICPSDWARGVLSVAWGLCECFCVFFVLCCAKVCRIGIEILVLHWGIIIGMKMPYIHRLCHYFIALRRHAKRGSPCSSRCTVLRRHAKRGSLIFVKLHRINPRTGQGLSQLSDREPGESSFLELVESPQTGNPGEATLDGECRGIFVLRDR